MKKMLLAAGLAAVLAAPMSVNAEGFAIGEWTTEGVAMGGARLFADNDPGNAAYNPASMTKVKGEAFKQSATYMSPHGKYDAQSKFGTVESGKNKVHAAWAPGAMYVRQANDKDWVGMALIPRFAMVSEFERNSPVVSSNAFFSKLNGMSLDVEYAHKFDKKWSAGVGAEVNYVGLELQKNQVLGVTPAGPVQKPFQLKGDSYALGWNAAANYAFDDKNEMGVVYRSRITHTLDADAKLDGMYMGKGHGKVTLPDSWSIGYNHKFDDKNRVELNAMRTNWSTYNALNVYFDNPMLGAALSDKNWESGWRYAIGYERKLSDKYTAMCGFAFDNSSIPYDGGDFLVPTGLRRTYSIGARYNDDKQALALALGWIDVGNLNFAGHPTDLYTTAGSHNNYVKIFSIGYERHF